jgi:hypothetical protein
VGVEDGGRDTKAVDKFRVRGREEGHAARVFSNCQGLGSAIDAGMFAPSAENGDRIILAEASVLSAKEVRQRGNTSLGAHMAGK